MSKTITDLQRFQVPYSLAEVPEIINFISHSLNTLQHAGSPDSLYRRSLVIEPRESSFQPVLPESGDLDLKLPHFIRKNSSTIMHGTFNHSKEWDGLSSYHPASLLLLEMIKCHGPFFTLPLTGLYFGFMLWLCTCWWFSPFLSSLFDFQVSVFLFVFCFWMVTDYFFIFKRLSQPTHYFLSIFHLPFFQSSTLTFFFLFFSFA